MTMSQPEWEISEFLKEN